MKSNTQPYYLIGMPGIGKSYYLDQLKQAFTYECIDLDESIESRYRMTIPDIIAKKGIEIFRIYEAITLRKLQITNDTIIACGGGTPCFHDNMGWINQSGISIYLHGSPAYIKDNYVKYQLTRPLLGTGNLNDYIENLYSSRIEYYNQADYTIDIERDSDKVANIIGKIVESHKSST